MNRPHKAKGPVRSHRASAENVLYPWGRLQSKRPDSIRAVNPAHPLIVGRCPICGQRRALGKRLMLSLFGQQFDANVCPMCHEAANVSASYRQSIAHQLAQRQQYQGGCYA